MKGRRKAPPRIPIEELSIEYGDVNNIPLVENKRRTQKEKRFKGNKPE
jgi:hypothetical protein